MIQRNQRAGNGLFFLLDINTSRKNDHTERIGEENRKIRKNEKKKKGIERKTFKRFCDQGFDIGGVIEQLQRE